ncbi:uncharacterized protein LOC115920747 [Strongylocentrotus purpuratus]|nr:uncharacterized protein LOC115920747 [Strongylocentrotus purpuratus]
MVEGKRVCRETFMFLHSVGNTQLRNITKSYLQKGVVPPSKASGGIKANKAALCSDDINRVVTFITNFADTQGLVIPGRISGVKSSDPRIRLLPTNQTKASVWRSYETELASKNDQRVAKGLPPHRSAKQTTFLNVWRRYCPFVITSRPKIDLCWQCQKNNSAVYQSANLTEEDKLGRIQTQTEHLAHVAVERNLYRDMVLDSQAAVKEGRDGEEMHYSFDYAQQMHFPTDPDQPGPMYFLCPRKCGLFGVTCDGTNKQVNYLIDEGMTSSKGSNSVISYLHDYFDQFGRGERVLQLHCDNCGGQNKNKLLMWYLAWRTLYGLHDEIGVHFMVSGHTKFSPDRAFGLVKHRYKRTFVSSLQDISDVVEESSVNGHNIPRLVGLEDGTVIVPSYDWQSFLAPFFFPLAGIKKYHHIRIQQ